ncbi:carbohydrate-binding module family 50 protein, partial [Aplosporella prunicola CBS 121167]
NASQQSSRTHLAPASSLRPRNKRLVSSGLDSHDSDGLLSPSSPLDSPRASRTASPIPNLGPSRSTSARPAPRSPDSRSATPSAGAEDALAPLASLWNSSWTSLQGLASNVLGSDASAASRDASPRRRRPFEATHNRKATSSAPPAQWGPAGREETQIGAGSKGERESLVRAMKRRDLLDANGELQADSLGRFKRRNSDERISSSAPPTEHDDRDALVYIHRVRPEDTLAGISIKYSCNPAVLRKTNRMWAQDSVQTRRHLVLPVDACAVKGRPQQHQPPEDEMDDLLLDSPTPGAEYPPIHAHSLPNTNGWHHHFHKPTSAVSDTADHKDNEPPWKHDSWVQLPHSGDPVEIARLPRKDLGFFPPARRKSLTFSDDAPLSAASTTNTSLDLHRTDTQSSSATTASPHNSLPRRSGGSGSHGPRPRAPSISQSFQLSGPGGVGTFGKNVRKPGPAQDGLNKLFSQHLPSLAPPPGKDYFGAWNPAHLAEAGDGSAGATPVGVGGVGGSTAGQSGTGANAGFDIEQIGGAVESWMRKMASKASALVPPAGPGAPGSLSPGGAGGADVVDVIELRDKAFEVGDDEEDRGR